MTKKPDFAKHKFFGVLKHKKLLFPGDSVENGFWLESGIVREYRIGKSGEEIGIHIYRPGSFFPLGAILNSEEVTNYYETMTDCSIAKIPVHEITDNLMNDRELLFATLQRFITAKSKLSARIVSLIDDDAKSRVASALWYLINATQGVSQKAFTQKDIASFGGLTRETVARELSKLKKAGLILIKNGYVSINEPEEFLKLVPPQFR